MESLKKFDEICQKDPRQDFFCIINYADGTTRKRTLEDFYKRAEKIRLHDGVPEKIRSHFETARNLIIYSWFYYPFNVTAELCAYTSVEFALKIKDGGSSSKISFKKLLQKAVAQKWIFDEGFSHVKRKRENMRAYNETLPKEFKTHESPMLDEYCRNLTKSLPYLRNELAHGSSMLHEQGAFTVQICADLINQLFPKPK
jgi:hypothetical protein